MSKKSKQTRQVDRWMTLTEKMRVDYPHIASWLEDEHSFRELRLKARDDETTIAVAKAYGADGGPVVCFGVGYGPILALMALDAAIQGGNWRVDKPWQPGK